MKIRTVRSDLFHEDGLTDWRTDRHDEANSGFSANMPKNIRWEERPCIILFCSWLWCLSNLLSRCISFTSWVERKCELSDMCCLVHWVYYRCQHFRRTCCLYLHGSLIWLPWRWQHRVMTKHWYLFTILHGFIFQKTGLVITAVITWNLAYLRYDNPQPDDDGSLQ